MQEINVVIKGREIPAEGGRYYVEFDNIRLVCEDGMVIGWYRPEVINEH